MIRVLAQVARKEGRKDSQTLLSTINFPGAQLGHWPRLCGKGMTNKEEIPPLSACPVEATMVQRSSPMRHAQQELGWRP